MINNSSLLKNYLYLISFLLFLTIFTQLIFINKLFFAVNIIQMFFLFSFVYLLISGFLYFLKIYQYSKYTASIQRFWRRLFNIFWLSELSWFLVFIYCILTASHEPIHYEERFLYKTQYLSSWFTLIIGNINTLLVIITLYCLLYFKLTNNYIQNNLLVVFIFIFILSFFFFEVYQFAYNIIYITEPGFLFNYTHNIFELNFDFSRFRPKVAVFMLTMIVKFWHCVFIVGSFFILLIKVSETKVLSLSFLSMSVQNFIIFYIMLFLVSIGWFKYIAKSYLRYFWYWFFMLPLKESYYIIFNNILIELYKITSVSNISSCTFYIDFIYNYKIN